MRPKGGKCVLKMPHTKECRSETRVRIRAVSLELERKNKRKDIGHIRKNDRSYCQLMLRYFMNIFRGKKNYLKVHFIHL